MLDGGRRRKQGEESLDASDTRSRMRELEESCSLSLSLALLEKRKLFPFGDCVYYSIC